MCVCLSLCVCGEGMIRLMFHTQAQDRYSETTSDEYLEQYCFRGVYVLYVLQDGFGFNKSSSGWNIRFVDQVRILQRVAMCMLQAASQLGTNMKLWV